MIWISIARLPAGSPGGCRGVLLPVVQGAAERAEVKRRISLLQLRNLRDADVPEVLKNEVLSDVPLLNRLLSQREYRRQDRPAVLQADMKIPGRHVPPPLPGPLLRGHLRRPDPALAHRHVVSSSASLLLAVPNIIVNIKRRLALKRFLNHFPEALEMFARSLRAGHSFTGAIQLVAQEMPDPIGPEFRRCSKSRTWGFRSGRPSSGCRTGSTSSTSSSSSRRS